MNENRKVTIVKDPDELSQTAATLFVRSSKEAVKDRGAFFVAVSGGSTPRSMHRLLAKTPYCQEIAWKQMHLFWVDDRCVPYSNPASNFGVAKNDFLSKVPLLEKQIHAMPTAIAPEKGAAQYERELGLVPISGSGFPCFDLIFLGIGSDGHTASLFPGQGMLTEKKRWVTVVKGGNPNVYRITLTFGVLNQARHIVFLVSGAGKASIVQAVLEHEDRSLPAQRICPEDGRLTWLLDKSAASQLSEEVLYDHE